MSRGPRSHEVAGPPRGVVEVWRVPLSETGVPLTLLTAVLDAAEWAHASRMRVGGEVWGAARGALRIVLACYLETEPRSIRFREAADGKPELEHGGSPRFSLSHTEGLALIAVASDREVGVDVERLNRTTDVERLSQEFLSPADAEIVRTAPLDVRRQAFFAAWTRHEARLKLRGQGLVGEPSEQRLAPGSMVLVRAVAAPEGYAAAVAAEGGGWTVSAREFGDALDGTGLVDSASL